MAIVMIVNISIVSSTCVAGLASDDNLLMTIVIIIIISIVSLTCVAGLASDDNLLMTIVMIVVISIVSPTSNPAHKNMQHDLLKLKIVFVQGGSPTPHLFSSRPHFVCKFSRQRSTKVF